MERTTFTDADVIRLANENYIPIRVDRDLFPELDDRYQAAASATWAAASAWPLAAFLTPDGDLLHAEGYLPPEDGAGRPGMRQVLQVVAGRFRDQRADLVQSAADRRRVLQETRPAWTPVPIDGAALAGILEAIRSAYPPDRGGWERLMAFPDDPALDLALMWAHRTGDSDMAGLVAANLAILAASGLHDPIGGGFHRAAADSTGRLPHFEKPLITNARLLKLYLQAWQVTGEDRFRAVAEGIVDFVLERLTDHRHGGFFNAVSAETGADGYGTYYTWTQEEIRSAANAEQAKILLIHYDVGARGEVPKRPDRNVLSVAVPAAEIGASLGMDISEVHELLGRGLAALEDARGRRTAPPVDRRQFADANGYMIGAMLEAWRVLGRDDCRAAAMAAVDRIHSGTWRADGMVSHVPDGGDGGIPPRLADQVPVALAMLDAFEAQGREQDLRAARDILDATLTTFRATDSAALLDLPADPGAPGLLGIERRPVLDPLIPAANALAAAALDRLSYLTKDKSLHLEAARILGAFGGGIGGKGARAATWGLVLEHHIRHPIRVVVLGPRSDAVTAELTRAAHEVFHPGKMVLSLDPDSEPERVRAIGYPPDDRPLAYVCTDQACAPPVYEPDRIDSTMNAFARRAFERNPLWGSEDDSP
jgi:uncharacterized protein YyaL (SSP411 family)